MPHLRVRTGAHAATTRLNAEQVIEQGAHEVVVQKETALLVLNEEREDRKSRNRRAAHQHQFIHAAELVKRFPERGQTTYPLQG